MSGIDGTVRDDRYLPFIPLRNSLKDNSKATGESCQMVKSSLAHTPFEVGNVYLLHSTAHLVASAALSVKDLTVKHRHCIVKRCVVQVRIPS
jgi:hypothetical protein